MSLVTHNQEAAFKAALPQEVALANPYLQYGHVRWQDGEHLLREEGEVTENKGQKGFFQRTGPACGASTASQRRMTPRSWALNFNAAMSLSLPRASRHPPVPLFWSENI